MSNTSENILSEDEDFMVRLINNNHHRKRDKYGRSILKSKENIFKPKSKYTDLKKKLKKYKLRKDGQEDSDVLYVSQFLSTSLIINPAVGLYSNCDNEIIDNWKVENYLTKTIKTFSLKIKMSEQEDEGCAKESSKEEMKNQQPYIKNDTLAEYQRTLTKEMACEMGKLPEDSPPENRDINKPKELNAFQIMMNARNKSIGSNSPGKEKTLEINEEVSIKKHLKLKRNLALEKLALAKGSLKKREIEALRDENIKIKMSKRAKRLKNMLNESPKKGNLPEKRKSIDFYKNNKQNSKNPHQHKRRRKSDGSEKVTKRMKIESCKDNTINIDEDDDVNLKDLQNSKDLEDYLVKEKNKTVLTNATPKESTETRMKISQSDANFMNKLSPSIKKKESMLSYFKVDKNSESPVEEDFKQESVIKVKFTTRRKKKDTSTGNNESLELTTINNEAPVCNVTVISEVKQIKINENFLKRKNVSEIKKEKAEDIKLNGNKNKCIPEGMENDNETNDKVLKSIERRSKRVSKKPVKYQDSIDSNSDDDIFILTPENPIRKTTSTTSLKLKKNATLKELSPEKLSPTGSGTEKKHDTKINKTQPSKFAPIFAQKTQLTKSEIEAKQRFLQSGIPDELKKILEKQKSIYLENDNFEVVHHIQQKTSHSETFNPWNLKMLHLNLSQDNDFDTTARNKNWVSNLKYEKLYKGERIKLPLDIKNRLEVIKTNYPKFPVYRTYRFLKNKCMPDNQPNSDLNVHKKCSEIVQDLLEFKLDDSNVTMWFDKFKPSCTNDIIGNFEGVKTLKKWLIDWKEINLDNKIQLLRHRSDSSDSSDFYYPSDTDSRDSTKSYNNVLVITGPVGCGKTSTIYAIATELAIKVIEVNASSKRTGKMILSNLHEATQSHKVNRGSASTDNSQNSQELSESQHKSKKNKYLETCSKKSTKPRKIKDRNEIFCNSQLNKNENIRTAMSLILVEDADLVFEQDDGFVSALNQIIQTSKRPVILVTTSIACHHLQRYVTSGNVVKFHHLSPKMLGTWLDVMCLVENGDVFPNMGQNLLEYYAGDIRKAINILQFWVASENKNINLTDPNESLPNTDIQDRVGVDDECSTITWTDQDPRPNDEEKSESSNMQKGSESMSLNASLFQSVVSAHDHDIGITTSVLQFPVNHLNIWWNIPRLFGFNKENVVESNSEGNSKDCLNSLARLIDSISVSDIISAKMRPNVDTSVVSSPWKNKLSNGVSETADLSSYSSGVWLADSMSYALLTSSINSTKRQFGMDDKEFCIDYTLPGMSQIRWRDRILSRHNGLYDGLSLSCRLDRRSLATDYLASCRQICRIEKDKSDNNSKRNNRFCHYLRSAKVSCSGDTLESLCESLHSVKN